MTVKPKDLFLFTLAFRPTISVFMSLFITFEGGEGCGKSTQAKRLKEYLEQKGKTVVLTKEPGGTPVGDEIRNLLLKKTSTLSALSELFLFLASRTQHVEDVIAPALKGNKMVISDRFSDSSVAYQGGGRRLGIDLVKTFNNMAIGACQPHLTFLLDCPPEIGLRRLKRLRLLDRLESEKKEFHEMVRKTYLELAQEEKNRFVVINAEDSPDIIFEKIKMTCDKKMSEIEG